MMVFGYSLALMTVKDYVAEKSALFNILGL